MNKNIKMKKIILLMFCMVILVGNVSALEWDNRLVYSNDDLKVDLINWFGFGVDYGSAELKSHLSVDYFNAVGGGGRGVPMYYDFNFTEIYEDGLGVPELKDKKTGELVDRNWNYVYWGNKNFLVPVYSCEKDILLGNGSYTEKCLIVDYNNKSVEEWLPYNSRDIPKDNIRIGIEVDVLWGDYIDGVWIIGGKKVEKHAEWGNIIIPFTAYKIFNVTGNQSWVVPTGVTQVTILVVAGGGGGAGADNPNARWAGGGGAGGLYYNNYTTTPGENMTVWVGLGGTRGASGGGSGSKGGYSNFGNISVEGGGLGGGGGNGGSGGSGGGASAYDAGDGAGGSANVTFNQGNDGASSVTNSRSGGGGGHGSVGSGSSKFGGDGKIVWNWNWAYGGNGTDSSSATPYKGKNAFNGTGGGGEGARGGAGGETGGHGASGVVIVAWDIPTGLQTILNSPDDSAIFNVSSVIFNITGQDDSIIENVSLWIDGVRYFTITNGVTNITGMNETFDFLDGVYEWTGESVDDEVNILFASSNRTFTINTTPSIEFVSPTPINYFNTTINDFMINVSVNEDYFLNITFNLYNSSNYNLGNLTFINNTRAVNFTDLDDGQYIYNVTIRTTTGQSNSTESRNISIDANAPNVNVTSPTGIIAFHLSGDNLTFNWEVSDPNLDSCWFNYDSTNTTVTCGDGTIPFVTTLQKNLTFYANDSFGNEGSNLTTWDYKILEINQSFNNETIEGATETFKLSIQTSIVTLSVANLFYNTTSHSGTITDQGSNNYLISATIPIPDVEVNLNQTFFWELTPSDSLKVNSTKNNQTVRFLGIDDCSVHTNLIFNYTVKDEGNQSVLINTTVDLNIDIFDSERIFNILNFSKQYSETNPIQACLSLSLLNSTNYSLDSVAKYVATNYVIEYYNIVKFVVANSTIPKNIDLFDLLSADSTEFKITFKDENFVPVENALIFIDRQYIPENNTFKTVELPKTDSNGETVGHFVRNDIVYNIRVVKDNIILGNFENIIAFCQDITIENCQIILDATTSLENIFNYDERVGLIYDNPTFNNNTNIVSFNFVTSDGTTKEVTMQVNRNDIFGNISLCNNTVTSSSGSLSCEIPSNIDETNIFIQVFVDGVLAVANTVKLSSSGFGNIGYIVWFILSLALMIMLGDDKTRLLISLVISYIGAIALGLSDGTLIGNASTGVWIIVSTIVGIYKLNKDNPQ